jgi:Fic family protein
MNSFVDLDLTLSAQPARLGVLLHHADVGRGREELYRNQLTEVLDSLAEETKVASITASSAIEGVTVEAGRGQKLALSAEPPRFRNRNEREFAGYRDAIDEIMRTRGAEALSVPFILHLHRQLFRHVDGNGGHLKADQNFIISYEGGKRTILFEPPPPEQTEFMLTELVHRYGEARKKQAAHPLVLLAAFVLDFLAIHPFADGNGRVARILTTHLLLREGYGVPEYVSVEQRIFETKNSYYDALGASQRGWLEARHSPWPWIEYLATVLSEAYDALEKRVAAARSGKDLTKQERVRRYVLKHAPQRFTIEDVRWSVLGVSTETIRLVLARLRKEGIVKPVGFGRSAAWERVSTAQTAATT